MATNATIPAGSTEQWRNPKRYLWLIGLVVPSLAFAGMGLWMLTDWSIWFWLGPIVILVIVPAIDLFAGLDRSNPPDDVIEALEKDRYDRWITYLYLPIQYAGFIGAMWVVSGASQWQLTLLQKVGLAVSIGCIGGIGINTAHELGHKREENERWLSKIALAQSFYGHFYIEHNRGHHVRVATPEDPASSRVGENFYQFWPRTVWGSLKSAWRLEARRIGRRKQHPFRLSNDVLNAWLMSAVLWGGLMIWLGVGILPYLVIQAVVGFSLLEVVNYMEHYGMLRQKVGNGDRTRYERVDPSHSWNSNNIATNVLLYHLQRHSDGALCGVVTDRDIVIRGIAEGKDPSSTRVDEVCSGTVVSVGPDDDVSAVSKVFSDNQIRRVPVLDGDELVGIISQADLARELPNDQTGDVVQAICRN